MKKIVFITIFASFSLISFADSGFLDDYSMLEFVDGDNRVYINPSFIRDGAKYHSVMIDLPEIFISSDSIYRGLKADEMAVWAESFREAIIAEISTSYNVVESPGDGVLFVSLALADVHLKKAKRGFLSYTPIGLVANAAKSVLVSDFQNKISLTALTIEVELTDSQSDEIMGQHVEPRGNEDEPTSWEEVDTLMRSYGSRLRCRMDNTRRDEQVNCWQL